MEVNALLPHVNYIYIDESPMELAWCNGAMAHALPYLQETVRASRRLTWDDLIGMMTEPKGHMALIYGAARMSAERYGLPFDLAAFERDFTILGTLPALLDGMTGYLPRPSEGADEWGGFGELDEDWPEARVQGAASARSWDFGDIYRALKAKGYSVAEIMQMTWPGMAGALGV